MIADKHKLILSVYGGIAIQLNALGCPDWISVIWITKYLIYVKSVGNVAICQQVQPDKGIYMAFQEL